MSFALDYIDVATRIVEFRTKHPEGSLQQVAVDFREFAGKSWVVYTAAAYRSPDDARPGVGTAWEPVPGKTNFTRDSELQNAETAAWGRAIVAALAADTKKGIASAEEVRNRQPAEKPSEPDAITTVKGAITAATTTAECNEVWKLINSSRAAGDLTAADHDRLHADLKNHVKTLPKETP